MHPLWGSESNKQSSSKHFWFRVFHYPLFTHPCTHRGTGRQIIATHMASVVVDLCTPPSSPQHASRGGGDDDREEGPVIDLCTPPPSPQHASGGGSGDDEAALDTRIAALKARVACLQDDEQKRKENKRKETQDQDAPPVKVQRPAVEPSSSADTGSSPMDDDEVLETAAPPALNKVVQIGGEDDEDEVQCTGRSGDNALMDFPHARENCCVVKFVQGQVLRTQLG